MGLKDLIRDRHLAGNPIRVALVGAGYMSSGILNIIEHMKGIEVVILWDSVLGNACKAYENVDVDRCKVVCTNKVDQAKKAIEDGKKVATDDLRLLAEVPIVDVVIDGTTSPLIGANIAFNSIINKKHIVTINLETDVTVGHILRKLAENSGAIYTVTAGEEPAVIKELYDHADSLGFEIVAGGKGKNNPLQVDATPETVAEKVPKIGITADQITSFIDGSKTMVEMTCAANATGLVPDVRGMHGTRASLLDLPKIFRLREEGGILNQKGVVDYVIGGGVDPGVFLVVTTENRRLISDLEYLKLGKGPNYVLYHPYHLWFIDTALSAALAVLKEEATLKPMDTPKAEVVAVAKRNLKAGEKLDGIGGYCVHGIIEKWGIAEEENLLPYGLTEETRVAKDIEKGKPLTYDDVQLRDSVLSELRRLQNDLYG